MFFSFGSYIIDGGIRVKIFYLRFHQKFALNMKNMIFFFENSRNSYSLGQSFKIVSNNCEGGDVNKWEQLTEQGYLATLCATLLACLRI